MKDFQDWPHHNIDPEANSVIQLRQDRISNRRYKLDYELFRFAEHTQHRQDRQCLRILSRATQVQLIWERVSRQLSDIKESRERDSYPIHRQA
jgi:hypothetical protein